MYILDRNLSQALAEPAAERVLEFVTKWGRNASPFNIAMTYVRLHWKGISFWRDVARRPRKAGI